jgi:hypothetical protein
MRTLHAIGEDLEALDAVLAEMGGDVSDAEAETAVDAWLAELGQERDAKLDRYAAYIADLEARAKVKREEAKRLAERSAAEEARVKMLKTRLMWFFAEHGLRKLDTPLCSFTVCANGGSLPVRLLVDAAALPAGYRDEVVTWRPRTDDLRAALESGSEIVDDAGNPVAELGERGTHLRIR